MFFEFIANNVSMVGKLFSDQVTVRPNDFRVVWPKLDKHTV